MFIFHQRLHETCWGGWSMKEITWERVKTFSNLYFPSAFGLASDFWRVAVIGTIAAGLGEEEVAVFNTSYRIMWIVLILVMALVGASGINMTTRLGRMDHIGAKQAGYVGCGMTASLCTLVGLIVWFQIESFGRMMRSIWPCSPRLGPHSVLPWSLWTFRSLLKGSHTVWDELKVRHEDPDDFGYHAWPSIAKRGSCRFVPWNFLFAKKKFFGLDSLLHGAVKSQPSFYERSIGEVTSLSFILECVSDMEYWSACTVLLHSQGEFHPILYSDNVTSRKPA